MRKIKGEHIWIIGASSGIGAALAKVLAHQGATLTLSARRTDALEKLVQTLPGQHRLAPLDVADVAAVQQAVTAAAQTPFDRVIFMPAIYSPHSEERKPLTFIHQMIQVNLASAFTVVETLLPMMIKQGRGQFVLCGSVAGYRGLPCGQPYCATKAGLINYAESLKVELASNNIDVKVINPGFVKTPLTDKNDFPMPMMIEVELAAKCIAKGLQQRGFEIHFPKRFSYLMKLLRLMPNWLYFRIAKRLMPHVTKGA